MKKKKNYNKKDTQSRCNVVVSRDSRDFYWGLLQVATHAAQRIPLQSKSEKEILCFCGCEPFEQ